MDLEIPHDPENFFLDNLIANVLFKLMSFVSRTQCVATEGLALERREIEDIRKQGF